MRFQFMAFFEALSGSCRHFINRQGQFGLPCNHVFGRECVIEWLRTSPTSDYCMICRTQLYTPPLWVRVQRFSLITAIQYVTHLVLLAYYKFRVFPPLVKLAFKLFFLRTMPVYWVQHVIEYLRMSSLYIGD